MQDRFKDFTVLISRASRCIKKLKSEKMNEFNLKGPHVYCLYYLNVYGSMTASELGELCNDDKAMLSRSLDDLEERGLIKRDLDSRYRNPISLTAKGEEVAEKMVELVGEIVAEASQGLSEQSRTIMYESLERICSKLEKMC